MVWLCLKLFIEPSTVMFECVHSNLLLLCLRVFTKTSSVMLEVVH